MLESELRKYLGTPLAVRIRKNINLLSLEGKPAPALEGVALPNGKPVLLFFWARWCGDCRAEAPILAQLKKEFGPRGLTVIGLTQKYGYIGPQTDVPPGVETAYIEQIRQQYYAAVVDAPSLVSETNFLTYGVSTSPTLTLVDRVGIVRLYHPGGMKYDELKAAIEVMMVHPWRECVHATTRIGWRGQETGLSFLPAHRFRCALNEGRSDWRFFSRHGHRGRPFDDVSREVRVSNPHDTREGGRHNPPSARFCPPRASQAIAAGGDAVHQPQQCESLRVGS